MSNFGDDDGRQLVSGRHHNATRGSRMMCLAKGADEDERTGMRESWLEEEEVGKREEGSWKRRWMSIQGRLIERE